eukprot:Rmarinus@m.1556
MFSSGSVGMLIDLAKNGGGGTREMAASVLARCCDTTEHQEEIAGAGGLLATLSLLREDFPRSQETALEALGAMTRDNASISREVSANVEAVSVMLKLVKDRRPRMRLLASTAIANLAQAGVFDTAPLDDRKQEVSQCVLPTLVKLFDVPEAGVQEEVPFVLAHLVQDNEDLQQSACELECVKKLAALLTRADRSDCRLREGLLTALAALCALREEGRKQVIQAKVLPEVVGSLGDSSVGVRLAACKCARSLSRSHKNLRTALVDAGVAIPLSRLLDDESQEVKIIASATLCNIVLDFTPMKKVVLDHGVVQKLVSLTESMDSTLRLNSVWAIKNLVYMADRAVKDSVMQGLGYDTLFKLLQDGELRIQEQSLNVLRNLAYGKEEDISRLFAEFGERLLQVLNQVLDEGNNDIALQALYVVCNISTGNEEHKQLVMNSGVLDRVIRYLSHGNSHLRVAATWCIINLSWKEEKSAVGECEARIRKLRDLGVADQLVQMREDADIDVRDRVKTALEQFAAMSGGSSPPQGSATASARNGNGNGNEDGGGGGGGRGGDGGGSDMPVQSVAPGGDETMLDA